MKLEQLRSEIQIGTLDKRLADVYGTRSIDAQRERYIRALTQFGELYGTDADVALYSVPGRSELAGNHTDHNRGKVIAASISLDIIAVVARRNDNIINLKSEGFDAICVDIAEYSKPREELFGTSASLIAGMCRGFSDKGYSVGGFDAYCTSDVLRGSGLSSSAAFEDMIGNILNYEYNGGRVDNVEIAMLAQYAENVFFGKPCGLMDQVACAVGGVVGIDFADADAPKIEKIDFDLSAAGYRLCIVDTGGNHADLTGDYAAVPSEMRSVANYLGKTCLRECTREEIESSIANMRESLGDRAVLRALHFLDENDRVTEMTDALRSSNIDLYLSDVIASGRSSFCYLQNVYTNSNVREQGLSLALCLTESFMRGRRGAFRVHGGGFAGTVQAYVAESDVDAYRARMDSVFGEGSCLVLSIRRYGAIRVSE